MLKTTAHTFPTEIRSHVKLDADLEARVRAQLARRIGSGMLVERATVRFEDANGPKGGVDTSCRIQLAIAGKPSIVVEKRATSVPLAFADAVQAIGTTLSRATKKQQQRAVSRPRLAA